jgi:hypothetical protein
MIEIPLELIIGPHIYIISLIDRFIEDLFTIYCTTVEAIINVIVSVLCAVMVFVCLYVILWMMGIILYLVEESDKGADNIMWLPLIYGFITFILVYSCVTIIMIIPCIRRSVQAT